MVNFHLFPSFSILDVLLKKAHRSRPLEFAHSRRPARSAAAGGCSAGRRDSPERRWTVEGSLVDGWGRLKGRVESDQQHPQPNGFYGLRIITSRLWINYGFSNDYSFNLGCDFAMKKDNNEQRMTMFCGLLKICQDTRDLGEWPGILGNAWLVNGFTFQFDESWLANPLPASHVWWTEGTCLVSDKAIWELVPRPESCIKTDNLAIRTNVLDSKTILAQYNEKQLDHILIQRYLPSETLV